MSRKDKEALIKHIFNRIRNVSNLDLTFVREVAGRKPGRELTQEEGVRLFKIGKSL